MAITKKVNTYLLFTKQVLLLILFSGCISDKQKCINYESSMKLNHYNLVLSDKEKSGRYVKLTGYNEKKKKKFYDSYTSDIFDYYEFMEIGDTLIKNKGELNYKIIKKNKIYVINLKCGQRKIDSLVKN